MLLEIKSFKEEKKRKPKLHQLWAIPIFLLQHDVICCSDGYIYQFLDHIKLLHFVNGDVIHHNKEHSLGKTPRELTERFTNFTHM